MPQRPILTIYVSGFISVAYGYISYLIFDDAYGAFGFDVFSWSFIMLVPYGVGAIAVYSDQIKHEEKDNHDYRLLQAIMVPWWACTMLYLIATAFSLGMLLCMIIALPIFYPAASLGGITVWLLRKQPKAGTLLITAILLAPFFTQSVEAQFTAPRRLTTTHTQIHIDASAETIWNNIKTVGVISAETQPTSWLHYIGIPRPIEATLSYEGVGGIRKGVFENGLQFDEVITEWQPQRTIAFTIDKSSRELLPKPLDMVDGEVFSIVSGIYEIEMLEDSSHILHFTSTHYLQTKFNAYGSYWTDYIMRDLQDNLLEVIKNRAETASNQ